MGFNELTDKIGAEMDRQTKPMRRAMIWLRLALVGILVYSFIVALSQG